MLAAVLWHPGGSFSILCFPEENWLLFSCLCSLLDRVFKLVFGNLRDSCVQSRFPVLRRNFSPSPFPKFLFCSTLCSLHKLSSKHYARMLSCLKALSFINVNWIPNANGCPEPSAVIINNRKIKAVIRGEIPSCRQSVGFSSIASMQVAMQTFLRWNLILTLPQHQNNSKEAKGYALV